MEQEVRSGKTLRTSEWDLARSPVRALNDYLHNGLTDDVEEVRVQNPDGAHHIAVGLDAPIRVEVLGNAGYYVGGMNKRAEITVHGSAGWSVAENIMSGVVRIEGFVSECAGASGHGGLVVVEKDASSRCGISMKGNDIVVGGDVGHFSAFMAQKGRLVVCGNAGDGLGDSLYEATLYVRGEIKSLGADAQEEPMTEDDHAVVAGLLERAGFDHHPEDFKRVASARKLYHWNAEHDQEY